MTRERNQYDVEIFKRTATWAEQIVSKDPDYQDYAGAPFDIGEKLALVDIALRYLIKDPQFRLIMKLYRAYLIQKRKAYFSGILANQITMLAFIKGGRTREIDALINRPVKSPIPEPDLTPIQTPNV
jgi:hypothetical protein